MITTTISACTKAKSNSNLENLITQVILNQTGEFSLEDIVHESNSQICDPVLYPSEELKKLCDNILKTLYHFDYIQFACKGKYSLNSCHSTVSDR